MFSVVGPEHYIIVILSHELSAEEAQAHTSRGPCEPKRCFQIDFTSRSMVAKYDSLSLIVSLEGVQSSHVCRTMHEAKNFCDSQATSVQDAGRGKGSDIGEITVNKHKLTSRCEVATDSEIATIPKDNIHLNILLQNYIQMVIISNYYITNLFQVVVLNC